MAREGFYDIRTYECLNRELTAKQQSFKTIPDYDLLKSQVQEKPHQNKRDKKAEAKDMLVQTPETEMRGHTGYLTFAIKF